jgi:hypothetical protein
MGASKQVLNEDINFGLRLTAPLKKYFIGGSDQF